jgi:hypothetical protein
MKNDILGLVLLETLPETMFNTFQKNGVVMLICDHVVLIYN